MEQDVPRASPKDIRRGQLFPPRLSGDIISRPRLVELMNRALQTPATLVVGPAGFGKTTALLEWLSTVPHRTTWMTLRDADTDVTHFVALLVTAVREIMPEFGQRALRMLQSSHWTPDAVGEALADDLFDLPEELILVLDDLHEVAGYDLSAVMGEILAFPSPKLHVILSSRWDPQLSLARLRGRGQLLEVRAADLRFTLDETRELLRASLGKDVDERIVELLHERTEGWIAGLRLASIALRGANANAALPEQLAASGDRHAMNFLMDEVLSRQPVELQHFLVRTAFLDELNGPLADAIAELPQEYLSGEAILQVMVQSSIFEERKTNGHVWYRCHPLFRSLLHQRLMAETTAEELRHLHHRASTWFAANGFVSEAIVHALEAGDVDEAAGLIERRRLEFLAQEKWGEVSGWLRLLPDDVIRARPALLLTQVRIASFRGVEAGIMPTLRDMASRLDRLADGMSDTQRLALDAEIALAETATQFWHGDPVRTLDAAERALAGLPADDPLGRGMAMYAALTIMQLMGQGERALVRAREALEEDADESGTFSTRVLIGQATIHLQQGDLVQCERIARYAHRVATDRQLPLIGSWARLVLGIVAYEQNDLDAAEEQFTETIAMRDQAHHACVRESMMGMALVFHARGDTKRMDAHLEDVLEWTLARRALGDLPLVDAFRAHLDLLHGRTESAARWMSSPPPAAMGSLLWFEVPLLTRVKALVTNGTSEDVNAALHHLDELEAWMTAGQFNRRLVEVHALRALALLTRCDVESAVVSMQRSLDLAGAEPFIRTYLDIGPGIRRLIPVVQERMIVSETFDRVVAAAKLVPLAGEPPSPNGQGSVPDGAANEDMHANLRVHVYELLTEREAEVLRCLSEHLTNQEIADRLFISPLTVKRHASNIYDKLGVGSRRQALIKATELGFLPPARSNHWS